MQKSKLLYNLTFCLLLLVCTFGFRTDLDEQPDSKGYLIFAEQILNFEILNRDTVSWPTVIRTPAYPALIALSQLIVRDNQYSILLLHFLFAFLALLVFVQRFSLLISPKFSIFLGFIALFVWREYYTLVLTEWIALCTLIIFYCQLPLKHKEFTARRLLAISLLAAFLMLLKPVFLCLLPVLAGLVLLSVPRENLRYAFTYLLTGLMPVFLWAVFNVYRLGTFSIAVFSGHNLFGNASMVGSASFNEESESRLRRFADYVNQRKLPVAGKERDLLPEMLENYQSMTKAHNYNVYQVALKFEAESGLSRAEYDSLMKEYALHVISNNKKEYLSLVLQGMLVAKRDIWLMLISLLCLYMMFKSGHMLTVVLATTLSTHMIYMVSISFLQINIERYYFLTLIPLGLFTICALLSSLVTEPN